MKISHSTFIFLALCSLNKANSQVNTVDGYWQSHKLHGIFWGKDFKPKENYLASLVCKKYDSFNFANSIISNVFIFDFSHYLNTNIPSKEETKKIDKNNLKSNNSQLSQNKEKNDVTVNESQSTNTVSGVNNHQPLDEIATLEPSEQQTLSKSESVDDKSALIESANENSPILSEQFAETSTTSSKSNVLVAASDDNSEKTVESAQNPPAASNLTSNEMSALDLADSVSTTPSSTSANNTAEFELTAEINNTSSSETDISTLSLSNSENNALDLANKNPNIDSSDNEIKKESPKPQKYKSRNLNVTGDLKYTHQRRNDTLKGAINITWQHQYNEKIKFLIRNRLSTDIAKRIENRETTNYLQEAYVSSTVAENFIVDVGRINNRKGIAIGYNPNDYLAVEQTTQNVSFDPEVSRKARLGNVSLNLSKFFDKSALNLIISPKLSDVGSDNSANLQLANTNPDLRFILSLHLEYITNLSTEVLVYLSKEDHPQFGFNLSFPLKDDIVAYGELSTGEKTSTYDLLINNDEEDWHTQFALGARWTPLEDFTVTGEFLYDDSGLSRDEILTLQKITPTGYQQLRQLKLINQRLFGKYATFTRIDWNNFLIDDLKFSAFNMYDLKDDSFVNWFELRYRYKDFDFSVQYFDPHQQNINNEKRDQVISTEINYYY
ncbi:hypothetical protein [Thorsellia kenyensis]|uniref:DUF3078 domain-containing protein n=1 Tax=Thorsellia kenyensis TaxID=1549888 RepID=A0ABV6CCA6_9GAMM